MQSNNVDTIFWSKDINKSINNKESFINVTVKLNLNASAKPPEQKFLQSFNSDYIPPSRTYNHSVSYQILDDHGQSHIFTVYFIKSANKGEWGLFFDIGGKSILPILLAGSKNNFLEKSNPSCILKFNDYGFLTTSYTSPIIKMNNMYIKVDFYKCTQSQDPFSIQELTHKRLNEEAYPTQTQRKISPLPSRL